jgi:hypothetical protein
MLSTVCQNAKCMIYSFLGEYGVAHSSFLIQELYAFDTPAFCLDLS